MNCPYCNNEMKAGSITTQFPHWTPTEGSNIFTRWINNVRLLGYSGLTGTTINAEYCSDCGKVIIDV